MDDIHDGTRSDRRHRLGRSLAMTPLETKRKRRSLWTLPEIAEQNGIEYDSLWRITQDPAVRTAFGADAELSTKRSPVFPEESLPWFRRLVLAWRNGEIKQQELVRRSQALVAEGKTLL